MNSLTNLTSTNVEIVKVDTQLISAPNEGLLLDIYHLSLSIKFNSNSKQKYEKLLEKQQNHSLNKFINPVFLLQNKDRYIIFANFRFFNIAKNLNSNNVFALIFNNSFNASEIYKLSLLHLLHTALLYDTSKNEINSAIRKISSYVKQNASEELKNFIRKDKYFNKVLKIPGYLHRDRTVNKPSIFQKRMEDIEDAEFTSYE